MQILTAEEVEDEIARIAAGFYLTDPAELAMKAYEAFIAPEDISTFDYSVDKRLMRGGAGGTTKSRWLPSLTPYARPVMEALDNPNVRAVVVPKPGRTGGTVVAENHLLKLIEFGGFAGCLWYLAGPVEVGSYSKRIWSPMFEDHEGVQRKLTALPGREGNTKTLKRIDGHDAELLAMGQKTTTNREGGFIVMDEPDSYPRGFRESFLQTAFERGQMLGNRLKIYACSHPDQGESRHRF